MKKPLQHLIAEVPRSASKVEMTIGIDLGDVWSHYCTLNEAGEVVDRGRFRTSPSGVEKWFTDLPRVRIAMESGTHSIWISEQLQELGHEVIVANVREVRAISHSDRKSDQVDAEKLARYARLDPKILRPISHRTVAQQEALTLIRARNVIVRLRTAAVNAVRGLAKPCGYRLPASSTLCFAKRCLASLPPGLAQALGPVLEQIATMTVSLWDSAFSRSDWLVGVVYRNWVSIGGKSPTHSPDSADTRLSRFLGSGRITGYTEVTLLLDRRPG